MSPSYSLCLPPSSSTSLLSGRVRVHCYSLQLFSSPPPPRSSLIQGADARRADGTHTHSRTCARDFCAQAHA
eukprot:4631046-Pleurochrysis_carterae.AAC.2